MNLKRYAKIRRQSKSERSKLIRINDDIFRQCLLYVCDFTCQYSGRKNNLQVSHYITRKNLHLRWEFDNCIIANAGVHKFTLEPNKQTIYRDFMISRIGLKKVEKLEMMSRVRSSPLYTCDLKLIGDRLRKKLKTYGSRLSIPPKRVKIRDTHRQTFGSL